MPKPKNKQKKYIVEDQTSQETKTSASNIKVGERKKTNNGRSLPKKNETSRSQKTSNKGSRGRFGESQRDEQLYRQATTTGGRFISNMFDANIDNSLAGSAYSLIAGGLSGEGKKLSDLYGNYNPYNQERITGRGSGAGRFIGTAVDYGLQYKAFNPLFEKGAEAIMNGTRLGNAIKNSSTLGKIGQKAGAVLGGDGKAVVKTASDVGKDLLTATVGDATLGVAQNFAMDYGGEGLRGKDLARQMAIDEAMDFGLGGLMEGLPYLKGYIKTNNMLDGSAIGRLLGKSKNKDEYVKALKGKMDEINRLATAKNATPDTSSNAFGALGQYAQEIRRVMGMDDIEFQKYQGKLPADWQPPKAKAEAEAPKAEAPQAEAPQAEAPVEEGTQKLSRNRQKIDQFRKGIDARANANVSPKDAELEALRKEFDERMQAIERKYGGGENATTTTPEAPAPQSAPAQSVPAQAQPQATSAPTPEQPVKLELDANGKLPESIRKKWSNVGRKKVGQLARKNGLKVDNLSREQKIIELEKAGIQPDGTRVGGTAQPAPQTTAAKAEAPAQTTRPNTGLPDDYGTTQPAPARTETPAAETQPTTVRAQAEGGQSSVETTPVKASESTTEAPVRTAKEEPPIPEVNSAPEANSSPNGKWREDPSSEKQINRIRGFYEDYGIPEEKVLKRAGVEKFEDLTKGQASDILNQLDAYEKNLRAESPDRIPKVRLWRDYEMSELRALLDGKKIDRKGLTTRKQLTDLLMEKGFEPDPNHVKASKSGGNLDKRAGRSSGKRERTPSEIKSQLTARHNKLPKTSGTPEVGQKVSMRRSSDSGNQTIVGTVVGFNDNGSMKIRVDKNPYDIPEGKEIVVQKKWIETGQKSGELKQIKGEKVNIGDEISASDADEAIRAMHEAENAPATSAPAKADTETKSTDALYKKSKTVDGETVEYSVRVGEGGKYRQLYLYEDDAIVGDMKDTPENRKKAEAWVRVEGSTPEELAKRWKGYSDAEIEELARKHLKDGEYGVHLESGYVKASDDMARIEKSTRDEMIRGLERKSVEPTKNNNLPTQTEVKAEATEKAEAKSPQELPKKKEVDKWKSFKNDDLKALLDKNEVSYYKGHKKGKRETRATLIAKLEAAGLTPNSRASAAIKDVKALEDSVDTLSVKDAKNREETVDAINKEFFDRLRAYEDADFEASEFARQSEDAVTDMLSRYEAEIKAKGGQTRATLSDIFQTIESYDELFPDYKVTNPEKMMTKRQWNYLRNYFSAETADLIKAKMTKGQTSVLIDVCQEYRNARKHQLMEALKGKKIGKYHREVLEDYFGDNVDAINKILDEYTVTEADALKARSSAGAEDAVPFRPHSIEDLSEANYYSIIDHIQEAEEQIAKNSVEINPDELRVGNKVATQVQNRIAVGQVTDISKTKIGNDVETIVTVEFPSGKKGFGNDVHGLFLNKVADRYSLITDSDVKLTTMEGRLTANEFEPIYSGKNGRSVLPRRDVYSPKETSNYRSPKELQEAQDAWAKRYKAEHQSKKWWNATRAESRLRNKHATGETYNLINWGDTLGGGGERRNLKDWDFTDYNKMRRSQQRSQWSLNADVTTTTSSGGTPTSSVDTDWTATNGGTYTYTNTEASKELPNKYNFNYKRNKLKDYGFKGNGLPKGEKVKKANAPLTTNARYKDVVARFGESKAVKLMRDIEKEIRRGGTKQTYETLLKSKDVSPEAKRAIMEWQQLTNAFQKEIKRDKDVFARAKQLIDTDAEKAYKGFNERIESGAQFTSDDVASAYYLIQKYGEEGQFSRVQEITEKLASAESVAGRTLHAMRNFHAATPEGRIASALRNVRQLEKRFSKRGIKIEIGEKGTDLLEAIFKAQDDDALYKANHDFAVYVWDQIPPSLSEKATAWRYLSMLYNPKTWIRNAIGNMAMIPTKGMADVINASIEKGVTKTNWYKGLEGADELKGTHAVINRFNKDDKALLDLGDKWFRKSRAQIDAEGSKWFSRERPLDSPTFKQPKIKGKPIKIGKYVFDPLNGAMKTNDFMLTGGDIFFMGGHYRNSFAQYLKANGIKASDVTDEIAQRAHKFAMQAAEEGTFRDANALADWLNNARKTLEPKAGDSDLVRAGKFGARIVMDATVPFVRTPMNILKRGLFEYNPIGVMRGLVGLKKAKTAQQAMKAIQLLGQGATGTTLAGLGFILYNMGVLSGSSDYDKQTTYAQMLGEQDYAVSIGDKSYTVDWVVPDALPLFMGVELAKSIGNGQTLDEKSLGAALDSLKNMADPIFELSMLQGIENTFQMASKGEKGLGDIAFNAMGSYMSQFIPTVVGQASRTYMLNRKTAVSTSRNASQRKIDKIIGKLLNKTPLPMFIDDYVSQDYVDLWGRTDSKSTGVQGTRNLFTWEALENFFSPGYYSKDNTTPVDKELKALYERLDEESKGDIIPTVNSSAYIQKFDDKEYTMTPSEFTQYKKTVGQYKYAELEKLFQKTSYQNASDDEKRKMIKDVYDKAGKVGKMEYLSKVDSTFASAPEFYMLDERTREKYAQSTGVSKSDWAKAYNDLLSTSDERKTETGTTLTTDEKRYILMDNGITSYKGAQSILGENTSKSAWEKASDTYSDLRKQYPSENSFRDALKQMSIEERELEEKRANMSPNERTYDTYFTSRAKERYDGKSVPQNVYDAYLKEAWYVDQHNPTDKKRNGSITQDEAYTAIVNLSKRYNLTQAQKAYLWALSQTEKGWKKKPFG